MFSYSSPFFSAPPPQEYRNHFLAVKAGDVEQLKNLLKGYGDLQVTNHILAPAREAELAAAQSSTPILALSSLPPPPQEKKKLTAADLLKSTIDFDRKEHEEADLPIAPFVLSGTCEEYDTLLEVAARYPNPRMVKYLLENYPWGFRKVQDALRRAVEEGDTVKAFLDCGCVPSLLTVYEGLFRRPISNTAFDDEYAPSQISHLAIETLIEHDCFRPQQLLHCAVLGDANTSVKSILEHEEGAVTVTRKCFWILGYNSVTRAGKVKRKQTEGDGASEGTSTFKDDDEEVLTHELPVENLRAYPAIRKALEYQERSSLLPEWTDTMVAAGRQRKGEFIQALNSAVCGATKASIRAFEEQLISEEDTESLWA